MMLMLGVLTVAVLAAAWYYFSRKTSYWAARGVNQTNPIFPFGDNYEITFGKTNSADWVKTIYDLYPKARYIGCYHFTTPVLMLKDPDLIKQVTVKDFDSFPNHAEFADPESDLLWSKNLFALKGERWKEMRHVISPNFTSSKIKILYGLMSEAAEDFVKFFQNSSSDGAVLELEMKDVFTRFANDVIASTAFGIKVDSLRNRDNTFYLEGKKITDFSSVFKIMKFFALQALPKLCKLFGIKFFSNATRAYMTNVIEETIKLRQEQNIIRPDIIQILLDASRAENPSENGNSDGKRKHSVKISLDDISSQAVLFSFAGFDTVSTAISFVAHELAVHKEIQDRLREEIRETSQNGKITYEALQQMKYLDMVVSEVLRKWPPTPFLDRICSKPYTIEPKNEGEKHIKLSPGTKIWLPIYGLHHDPRHYPEPEKFLPERFSEENKGSITPYLYAPFGFGPRSCIGNRFALIEVKALLYNLLLNFEIIPVKKTQNP
nr:cytochrome P450 monooxygenase CYP9AZ3 [Euwallacea interjectus]